MASYKLAAELRGGVGSSAVNRLRRGGQVPAVIYSPERPPVTLQINSPALDKAIQSTSSLIDLEVEGQKRPVLVKEVQRHPVKQDVLHVDFYEVSMDREIETTVSITLVGEENRADDEGVINQVMRELTVACLPMAIPEVYEVDISELGIGDSIYVEQLPALEGVRIIEDPDELIVSITMPTIEEEPEEEEEELLEGDEALDEAAGDEDAESEDDEE